MGKKSNKKKNKKSEFDDFFDKKEEGAGWMTGVSAMALDDEKKSSEAGAAEADMDTGDGSKAAKSGLGVQKSSMKAVRGQRTKTQKLRKAKLAEKATARADKVVVRVGTKVALKQKKSSLKHIY
ncbi:hypothetical protein CHLRE_03g183250v5 [Chlamydomonas reinhardtii]|uniref:Uncharacterized protein n=1 Tax=Chlamydomonas reinhardtii TaxID=3055 RepID=A0A2K3DXW5_CHLRE|nr:uncharacterized protein CHLRE_03g183250v5 [Chlamydomonas reinhardtii]PNW85370.1 hypothetical protein CHLRE_03g183250v5 [Chlamydomonas reinhardtii]